MDNDEGSVKIKVDLVDKNSRFMGKVSIESFRGDMILCEVV